jgi:hypothetical protein
VGDWGNAAINRPVTIGDKLWVDQNARLELQAGEASIHAGAMTALSFLNLDQAVIQMRLAEGHINFRVRDMRQGDVYEVDTPNLAFNVKQAGAFRVDVNENGDTTGITVIRGEGEVAAGGKTYTVHAGERASVTGLDNAVQYSVNAMPLNQADDLDNWANQRDLKEENSTSAKYVSREVVGYSDLDDYGSWKEEPTYGNVWYPNNVDQDWAPYSNGNWAYVAPWGWTWNDYAPWGFAPFHYGRWIYGGGGWGWCPGPIYARPFYGPAFVGFLGGFHFGIGFGFGFGAGVGWFPLGWGEPFHPWYHAGGGYWNSVNVHNTFIRNTNVINSNNHYNYAYAHNTHAVTVASHNTFANGQAINRGATHVTQASLNGAHVTSGVNASPNHASYLGASASHGRVAMPSSNIQNRAVVARTAPAASASHLPVRTMNSASLTQGRTSVSSSSASRGLGGAPGFGQQSTSNRPTFGGSNSTNGSYGNSSANRQTQIAANRPPSAVNSSERSGMYSGSSLNNNGRSTSAPTRTWSAQGNQTDSGRGPQGFGENRNMSEARTSQVNRPPWANGSASPGGNNAYGNNSRGAFSYSNGNRSYTPPSYNGNRPSYSPRQSSAPSYNGNRGSSAPRSYSAPHSSAPHNSGGGGSSHSGGSGSHGGGGGSHGGGGGGSHGGGHH